MSHFYIMCHYDFIINIVISLAIFYEKKTIMQSGENRMKVASKHFSPSKVNDHMEQTQQTPIPGK